MKLTLIFYLLICCIGSPAQTKIEKAIPVKAGQTVLLDFDDPDIQLHTWDKSEILIKGTVNINRGENDNAFELQSNPEGNQIKVTSILKDKENIPHRIMIKKNDREYYFKAKDYNDPEVQKFLEENGREYSYTIVALATGELVARSRYGEILTNLDIKFDLVPLTSKKDHWTEIAARPGKGPKYSFESKYGNVYLRKPE